MGSDAVLGIYRYVAPWIPHSNRLCRPSASGRQHDPPLMTDTDTPRLDAAVDIVDREADYISDERAAFDRFRARLSDIEPTHASTADGAVTGAGSTAIATAVSAQGEPGPGAPLRAARDAYRETVMAVRHYESEYGDTLRESLAEEFGAEVSTQVVDGRRLTPTLYRALRAGSESASDDRARFRRELERERESLASVRTALLDCHRRISRIENRSDGASTETLSRFDGRLAALEATCEDLADERQELIHGRSGVALSGVTGTSLPSFLYADLPTRCPGLLAVTDCLDRIYAARRNCLR